MMKTLEQLLDLCLAQLNTGDKDLAMVLAQYPEQRAELEPMLRAALAVRHTPIAQPRPEARAAGKERLVAALLARLSAEALDTALTLLKSGQPLDTALAESPHADELSPLLRLALTIQQAPQPPPSLAAQAAGFDRLIAAVEARRRMLDQLDDALTQAQAGQSVQAALAEAGSAATRLAPALRAAQVIQATPQPIPRPAAKAAGLALLQRSLKEREAVAPVLDRALAELHQGQSLETVLARYPLYARTLEPLLRMSQRVQATPEPLPRPEAKAAGLTRVLDALAQRRAFEMVLDRALADLRAGRADIPMLLARYPDHAAALEPMLLAAHVAQTTPPPLPRVRAKAEGRTQLMAAVASRRSHLVAEKLDLALARIRQGETVAAVLATMPECRAELEPLIQTALAVEHTPAPVADPQARLAGERRLVQMAQMRRRASRPVWAMVAALISTFNAPRGLMRQAMIGAMAVLFFVSSTLVGVTRAAATSLPDEALYPVKLVTEQVQLALAPSPEAKAQLHLAFAQERLRETQAAVDAGRSPARAIAQLPRHIGEAADALDAISPAQRDAYSRQLEQFKAAEKRVLEDVKTRVAPDVQTVIIGIVGTATATVEVRVLAPTATLTPAPPTATWTLPAPTIVAAVQVEPTVLPPTKTPLPQPTAVPQPTQAPPTAVIPPTLAPTQPPTLAPTEPPPPTDTPPAVVVVPPTRVPQVAPGGSQPTRAPEPTATAVLPTDEPGQTRTPAPPTQTPLPQPTATSTPVTPEPTVIVPPTRVPRTPTPAPPPTDTPLPPPPTATAPAPAATATTQPPVATATAPSSPPTVEPPQATATTQPPANTPQATPKTVKP